ncbi:MAG: cyclase family protein [Nitrospinae bacterium]|nr:cyclase family protein [Nitrospinota bacterium]
MSRSPDILDISLPISPGMPVWPGDPRPELKPVASLPRDGVQISRLILSTHTGTHLDAPRHFIEGGRTVDQLDLAALLGPCRVIEITSSVPSITSEVLRTFNLASHSRVLLKTANSRQPVSQTFTPDFIALDPSAADYLCERRVQLVGIDGPSVDAWTATDFPCHRRLLGAEILILENLVLRHVKPGTYELIAVPLNLVGADGCPVRALLLPPNLAPTDA